MDSLQRREVFGDMYDPAWEGFQADPIRQEISITALRVYRFLQEGNLAMARHYWSVATEQCRAYLGRIMLRLPEDYDVPAQRRVDHLLTNIRSVINLLHRSTNNESLQPIWRDVSRGLA